jgi:alkylhydroperoxidase family enzyme
MAWIRTIDPTEAEGLLARLYKAAIARAGKVYNIIRCQSLRPATLRCSTQLYTEVMFSPESALSRARREMIATVVSRVNACRY